MQARFNWETMAETQTETETETASPAERTPLRLPGVVCGKGAKGAGGTATGSCFILRMLAKHFSDCLF